jgi:hypothetical protein
MTMADVLQQGDGVVRQADTALRTNGGRTVLLRMAGPASVGDDAEQLGLATPEFHDVALTPCVFRSADSAQTLLVTASAVDALVGSLAFDSADVLFETAVGVVIDGVVYEIADSVASQAMGSVYSYLLTLRRPVR